MGRELTLRKALREVTGGYDVVLIDCPPALGLLTVNALVAADFALLSAEAQYFAMQGVEQALEVIELARDNLNPGLEWLGVVLNIADMRTRHSREAYDSLREHFGDKLVEQTIRSSIAYAESAERAQSIVDYRPDLGLDYLLVGDELLRRLGMTGPRRRLKPLIEAASNGHRPAGVATRSLLIPVGAYPVWVTVRAALPIALALAAAAIAGCGGDDPVTEALAQQTVTVQVPAAPSASTAPAEPAQAPAAPDGGGDAADAGTTASGAGSPVAPPCR